MIAVAVAMRPRDFAGGELPPDGGPGWDIAGEIYPTNPRLLIDESYTDMITLWRLYRGGQGGVGHLPDSGGVNAQSVWLLEAFAIMDSAEYQISHRGEA